MSKWFIYALVDSRTNEVRYVGKSHRTRWRLSQHIEAALDDRNSTHKDRWIRCLLCEGLQPVLKILEQGEGAGWQESEKWWIRFYREEVGAPLTNLTEGGEGMQGFKFSEESRAKMAVRKGVKLSGETRKKISDSLKGRPGHPHTLKYKIEASERRRLNPTFMKQLRSMTAKEFSEHQRRASLARWQKEKSSGYNTIQRDGRRCPQAQA